MEIILQKDIELIRYTLDQMKKYEEIFIYGDNNIEKCPRAGTISFNLYGMDHGLVSAILNDYFNIAVRNECFCAHPYVEKMLHATHQNQISELDCQDNNLLWTVEPWMGMVRASFGLYTTKNDIDKLIKALANIIKNKKSYINNYKLDDEGNYTHKYFQFSSKDFFSLTGTIDQDISSK